MRSLTAPPPPEVAEWAALYGLDPSNWSRNCHGASLAIVRSGKFPGARVARGTHPGVVGGQHSWVVLGDPYDPTSEVIDATLWSYDDTVTSVYVGDGFRYRPHGTGNIWTDGYMPRQAGPGEEVITLTPTTPLSPSARSFLDMLGPLGHTGWRDLAMQPVQGWPAAEIVAAMDDTDGLKTLVPIDIRGMLTDRNPGGLYL